MAYLYVNEYLDFPSWTPVTVIPGEAWVRQARLAIGASSAQGSAFSFQTRMIMVSTDAVCSIAIGLNPTADPSYERLAANETRFYRVNPGDTIAVITNT